MTEQGDSRGEPFFGSAFAAAPAAIVLPVVLVLCFAAQLAYGTSDARQNALIAWGGLSGQALHEGRWWTLFTSMFLHGGWLHISMNAAVALSVSTPVALAMGRGVVGFLKFWVLFLLCGLAGGLAYVVFEPNSALPAIGASGAISGLWGAMVRIPFTPGPLNAPWSRRALAMSVPFLLVNVLLMAALTRFHILPVAWQDHLGGFIAGQILISFFAVRRPRAPVVGGPWGNADG
ncbi:MAG TPA: rhomboid family intramembrane serine protease [Caulobacteraceae bacterium]|jgi:rhomboid protease GluP|nr:rhomboid family intramembrane serine protease [Caulobacteraceae bacterium]